MDWTDVIEVADARRRVLDAVAVLEPRDVLVSDAVGYAVAFDIRAPHPLPRFDNSAMDGYAVRSDDVTAATEEDPALLEVVGEVRAGEPGDSKVLPGTAVRIMTGAPIPAGADAVVPVEDTAIAGERVAVRVPAEGGRHIRPAGDDVREGDLLIEAGSEIRAGEAALLASMGISPVPVVRRPRVAALVTGDELVPPEATPGPGQIRDSNSIALRSLIADAGAEVVAFAPVPDELEVVIEAFRRASETADLVVCSGGASVGGYDFVKPALEELGAIAMWKVAMQPGKPVVLGRVGATPFLGLPGNPVSIHVTFEQFVRPAIRKMRGCRELLRPTITARLGEPLTKRAGRLQFVRVRLERRPDGWIANPTGAQGSHIQSSLIGAHGVARFDKDATTLAADDEVTVEVWQLPEQR